MSRSRPQPDDADRFDDRADDSVTEDYRLDDDDDESETQPCPHCGEEIYEDSDRCPKCGASVDFDTGVWVGRPWWWVALAAAGIVAMVIALMAR